jgi:DNA-binding MarR family transcriptional regulator/predicted N-acetyltransferase YhbS
MQQLPLDQKIAAMRRFARFFAQRLGALEAGPAGSSYSATEVRVLAELSLYDARTVTALSRTLGLDAGYLSRVIRRLETTGVVSKSASAADNRQQPLALTQQGQAEVRTIDAIATSRYSALIRTLPAHIHAPVLDAMERLEGAFGSDVPARDATPYLLRPHRVGDLSYIAARNIASCMEEFEFGAEYERDVLRVSSQFLESFDAQRECCWVAEREGAVVGSVLLRRANETESEVTMLFVESQARGAGIGRRLLAEAVRFAERAGYGDVRADLSESMKSARFLMHAAGFRHAGVQSAASRGAAARTQQWRLPLTRS